MSAGLSLHDGFFKKFLGDLGVARDFLDIHLPERLRQQCDLSTLAMISGSFIEDDSRSHCSDMLYSLKSTLGDAYIYLPDRALEPPGADDSLSPSALRRYRYASAS